MFLISTAVGALPHTAQLQLRSRGSGCASHASEWLGNCRCFSPVKSPAIPSFLFRKQGNHPHETLYRDKRAWTLLSEKNNGRCLLARAASPQTNPRSAHPPRANNRDRRV